MEEKRHFIHSIIFPIFFLALIWLVAFFEFAMELDFVSGGVLPRTISGLKGILFSPLLHADWKHLFDNSIPIAILSVALFYFYRGISYKIFFFIYFVSGMILWLIGRDAYHIGASGIIYGLSAFLFLSGVLRRVTHLMALSLLVVFLYGSLIWGLLPFEYQVSWEGHLAGAIVGTVLAVLFRDQGPTRPMASWELEDDDDDDDDFVQEIQEIQEIEDDKDDIADEAMLHS